MAGKGGYKHRKVRLNRKQKQSKMKARASVARAEGIFGAKGQAWDPKDNPAQLGEMNHGGRSLVHASPYAAF